MDNSLVDGVLFLAQADKVKNTTIVVNAVFTLHRPWLCEQMTHALVMAQLVRLMLLK